MNRGEGYSLKEFAWVDSSWRDGKSWRGGHLRLWRNNSGKQDLVKHFEGHSQATQNRTGGSAWAGVGKQMEGGNGTSRTGGEGQVQLRGSHGGGETEASREGLSKILPQVHFSMDSLACLPSLQPWGQLPHQVPGKPFLAPPGIRIATPGTPQP